MHYLILGLVSLYAGLRVLALRRRMLSAVTAGGPAPKPILRPPVLAAIAAVVVVGGAFLVAGGALTLAQGG
ncbi:hypothetical protein ACGFZG_24115 [Streptomyces antibioticus]|uniref:hypothetical protein n=1 Tax=Streptomyces TaxID=1883 RepID=UPI001587EF2C|nr:hypothetical protein [Streptomyces sp. CAI-85]MBO7938196.1 hypothetical protein [Streptomyces sp. S9]NUV61866.1 hypothetical protein [Streptomyces sp. CAI-85]